MRVLVAVDLEAKSAPALKRAQQFAEGPDSALRVVYVPPLSASESERAAARQRLKAIVQDRLGVATDGEAGVSVRLPLGKPEEGILWEAEHFQADLIVLGAHGDPRLRDAFFGTTAAHIAREARQPVLVVQNDPTKPYAKVMAAVDEDLAEAVVRLACTMAPARELFVVHAFGSVPSAMFGNVALVEDVRADQQAMIDRVLASLAKPSGSTSVRVHNIVKEGDAVDVLMRAWFDFRPDLVVMGTRERSGLSLFLEESVSQSVLLACPSDILLTRGGTT